MKPMLATDWDESKVKFPVIVQPKIDGVRALNLNGLLTGRSLKQFGNKYVTTQFSIKYFTGFDGEMVAADASAPDLCRKTTSALSSHAGMPFVHWMVFDFITETTKTLPYIDRYRALSEYLHTRFYPNPSLADWWPHVSLMPASVIENMDDLIKCDEYFLNMGYEGTILRAPDGMYKEGRSTVREGGLLRIKRFTEEEAVVISVEEGQTNTNEAMINALGQTERSTHQANMLANGMVGTIICKTVKDGAIITVSPGKMSHAERINFWLNKDEIIGKTIKYKHFPHGVKDKPRFPTFQSFRDAADEVTE